MKKRILCFTLILALLLGTISFTTFAEAPNEGDVTQNQSSTETEETQEKVDLKKQIVPENEVPDLIDYNVAIEKKYVCRAYWEETSLNEVVFLRADGALDRYIFSFPVKYTQGEETYDKIPELEIQETLIGGKYRFSSTEQNDITLLCADVASDGVLLQNDQMQISLRPITVSEYDFLRGYIEAGSVVAPIGGALPTIQTFDSVASEGSAQSALTVDQKSVTAAVYSLQTNEEAVSYAARSDTLSVVPSYTGFKMDLNLAPSGTQTQFCFLLDTNDLILVRELDTLLLLDAKGTPVGIVGDLLSENGAVADAQYTVTDLENGEYLLSAIVNRPAEASTVTMSVTAYYDYIQDASIYSNDQNTYGSSRNLWIGRHGSVGIEHVLIRPNNWYFTSSAYPNHVVQSANVVIRDITATTPEEVINCHPFTGSVWNESTATWNSIGGGNYGAVLDQNSVSADIGYTYGYYYYFNIAPLVRNWYSGAANWQKGVVFRWNNDGSGTVMEKCFASTQYPTEAYRPRFEVTTAAVSTLPDGVYYIRSAATNTPYLTATESSLNNANVYQQTNKISTDPSQSMNQLWRVKHVANGYYTVRPYHYTKAGLSADNINAVTYSIGYSDAMDEVASYGLWKIGNYAGSSHYYLNLYGTYGSLENYSRADGNVTVCDNYYGPEHKWTFELVENPPVEILFYDDNTGTRESPFQRATLVNTEKTLLGALDTDISISTPGNIDPLQCGWAVSDTSVATISPSTLKISALALGSVAITITHTYNNEEFVETFPLHVISGISEGKYYIQNKKSLRFVDIENQAMQDGTIIHQWSFHGSATSRWELDLTADGYYTIRSLFSGTTDYYLGVLSDSSADQAPVVLRSGTITDGMKWKIEHTDDGGYKIIPKVGESSNRILAVQYNGYQGELGLDIKSFTYSDDKYDSDEWYLRNLNDTMEDDLLNQGLISSADIKTTDDGFSIITKSLSDILLAKGIDRLYKPAENLSYREVQYFYDDWYFFAITNSPIIQYSVVKMREEEHDPSSVDHDGDTQVVTVPFIRFEMQSFLTCISNPSIANSENLFTQLAISLEDENSIHDETICRYFSRTESKGAYLIAEEYVKIIAKTCINGYINAPADYANVVQQESDDRLVTYVSEIDEAAGGNLYDETTNRIYISNPESLTYYEKCMILATHTGDANFNSFATEVEYHADMTLLFSPIHDFILYEKACRADLSTIEGGINNWASHNYRDLDSKMVKAQAAIHGNY